MDPIEQRLRQELAGVYAAMDQKSRAWYRRAVEKQARRARTPTPEFTDALVERADRAQKHVGALIFSRPAPTGAWYIAAVLLLTLFAAAGCDMFAYFCGRAFGRHKLCPSISPHKTVEGSLFGTVLGTALGMLAWVILRNSAPIPWHAYLIASFFCTIAGQLGDLCASVIKRQAGIKDFSDMLPGHGGFIDRIDSFCFAVPVAFFVLILFHA